MAACWSPRTPPIGTAALSGRDVQGGTVGVRVRGRVDLREHRPGDAEEAQEFVVPVEGLQIHQHGPARVGDVGGVDAAVRPAGQVPQDPGVRVPEDRVTGLRRLPHAVDVLQDPLDLAAREVRRRRQPGLAADDLALARTLQLRRDRVRAGVLPDDGVVVGPPVAAVPHHRGLPLVGDPDGRQIGRGQTAVPQRVLHDRVGALPDLHGIVLHPAGPGQDLLVLQLVLGDLVAAVVEDHESGAGGPLVHRADEVRHDVLPLRPVWVSPCPPGHGPAVRAPRTAGSVRRRPCRGPLPADRRSAGR
ncbi:hypothetical protein SCALM49S_04641 [Streptomyces californicus]